MDLAALSDAEIFVWLERRHGIAVAAYSNARVDRSSMAIVVDLDARVAYAPAGERVYQRLVLTFDHGGELESRFGEVVPVGQGGEARPLVAGEESARAVEALRRALRDDPWLSTAGIGHTLEEIVADSRIVIVDRVSHYEIEIATEENGWITFDLEKSTGVISNASEAS